MASKSIVEDFKELPAGWRVIGLIGLILIFKAIFELGISFNFAI